MRHASAECPQFNNGAMSQCKTSRLLVLPSLCGYRGSCGRVRERMRDNIERLRAPRQVDKVFCSINPTQYHPFPCRHKGNARPCMNSQRNNVVFVYDRLAAHSGVEVMVPSRQRHSYRDNNNVYRLVSYIAMLDSCRHLVSSR